MKKRKLLRTKLKEGDQKMEVFMSELDIEVESSLHIVDLPPEILEIIFQNLISIMDLSSCYKTCVNWKNIIGNNAMYGNKVKFLVMPEEGNEIVDLLNTSGNFECSKS